MVESESQRRSRIKYRNKPEVKEQLRQKSRERYWKNRNDPEKWNHIKKKTHEYRRKNKDYFKQKWNEYYKLNGEHLKEQSRNRNYNLLIETLSVYSHGEPKCRCCGEKQIEFLTIDHIDNGGCKHRKLIGMKNVAGVNFYAWLKRNDYPLGYQTLCWNCNCGKIRNKGVCPHKTLLKLNLREN